MSNLRAVSPHFIKKLLSAKWPTLAGEIASEVVSITQQVWVEALRGRLIELELDKLGKESTPLELRLLEYVMRERARSSEERKRPLTLPAVGIPGVLADRLRINEPRCTIRAVKAEVEEWISLFVQTLTLNQVKAIQDAFLLFMLFAAGFDVLPGLTPFPPTFVPRRWVSVCGTDRLAGPLVPRGPQLPALSAVRSPGHGAGPGRGTLVLAA